MYQFICNLINLFLGNLYPAYKLYKLLKIKDRQIPFETYEYYLKLFVVMACFNFLQYIGDTLIFWFPLYYELKIVMLLYITLPSSNGVSNLYEKYISVYLKRREKRIDEAIILYQKRIIDIFNFYYTLVYSYLLKAYNLAIEKIYHGLNNSLINPEIQQRGMEQFRMAGALPAQPTPLTSTRQTTTSTNRYSTMPPLRENVDNRINNLFNAYSAHFNSNNSSIEILSDEEEDLSESSGLLNQGNSKNVKFGFSNPNRRAARNNGRRFGKTIDEGDDETDRLI
ncbi:hypothetical protein K502DRAFT_362362 [Neoconidiobolus thromboides FSU 785]|nr:hypothetical protein K502DRAFT_362362 [Neoconidiobolus thromboides FSU 785]